MELISVIALGILGVIGAAASKLAADEFKAWRPTMINQLIRWAVSLLPEDEREHYAEEWLSEINGTPGEIGKLIFALDLVRGALKMSREIEKVTAISGAEVTLPVPVLLGWPSSVTLPDNAPAGTIVASGFVVMSDGSPFTGTVTIIDEVGNPAPVIFQPDALALTLGNAAATRARFIVWCLDCRHQTEPDPAEMAARYGTETTVPDWHHRLVCSQCGSRRVDFVITGDER